jgi:hypothetical protein
MTTITSKNPFLDSHHFTSHLPQLTIKYAKLQLPFSTIFSMERQEYENKKNQQSASFLQQNNEIPVIPRGSFESTNIVCSHGRCIN